MMQDLQRHRIVLERLLAEFPRTGIDVGSTPELAYNRCWDVSLAFTWYCLGAGLPAWHVRGESTKVRPFDELGFKNMTPRMTHWTTWLPSLDLVVDWTARQFWKDADIPWTLTTAAFAALWYVEWPPAPREA